VFWGGLFRGGLTQYFLGFALVRRDGRFAGMLRCFWRAILIWSPPCACYIASGLLIMQYWAAWHPGDSQAWLRHTSDGLWYLATFLLGLWFVLGVALPRRGPHDVLVGTYLVPR
jgi:hypothetical protein